jgi:tetratricopeptide (TPR) repeat protein
LRSQLFDNLLSDNDFIKARATSLGRQSGGDLQHKNYRRSASQIPDKNEWNLYVSTSQHTKDIEWCASILSSHQKEDFKAESIISSCLNAISRWRDELIASYQILLQSGKLTIHDYHSKGPELMAQTRGEQGKVTQDEGVNVVKMAESLLVKNDAWTMEDDSANLFQVGTTMTFQSPRPQRVGRRRKDTVSSSPLARILNININEQRTSISIGRSLLALSEFSRTIMDKYDYKNELNESGSVASQVHLLQTSCLQQAIEALACPATTLTYILSNALDNLDEDDLDETVTTSLGPTALIQRFSTTREESKLLLFVAGILSADAWYSLGSMIRKYSETGGSDVAMSIFDRALLALNFPKAISSHTMEELCQSLLSPLARCRCYLHSNITHSAGVYFYEQGDIHRADMFLTNATRFRRQMLDHLRRQDCENVDDINNRLSEIFKVVVGGIKNSSLVSSASMTEDAFKSVWNSSLFRTCVLLPRTTVTVDELESSLSLTLEYSALAQHAMQKYQSALALFQEALIIRNIHVGKHSLDVASLHFNMGVVCDDLEQYEQAISLYHESLRIRVIQRNKATSEEVISDLEDSLITT